MMGGGGAVTGRRVLLGGPGLYLQDLNACAKGYMTCQFRCFREMTKKCRAV